MCFSRNLLFSVYLRESHLVSVHRCPVIADVIGARRSSSSCCSCCHVALFSLSHLMTVCLDNICHWRPLALIVSLVETEDWLQRAQKTLRTVVDDPCDDIGNCVLMMSKFRVGVCWLWWWVFFIKRRSFLQHNIRIVQTFDHSWCSHVKKHSTKLNSQDS